MQDFRPTICIDFDGVVHQYSRGWQKGVLYDPVVPSFFAWARSVADQFEMVIYSSRSKTQAGIDDMRHWMVAQWKEECAKNGTTCLSDTHGDQDLLLDDGRKLLKFGFAHEKPAAWVTIDDRAVKFEGNWSDPALSADALRAFKPWNAPV